MRIKEGIYSFKLSSKAIGQESIINPTVIYDNDELILVDAGLPHQFHQISSCRFHHAQLTQL